MPDGSAAPKTISEFLFMNSLLEKLRFIMYWIKIGYCSKKCVKQIITHFTQPQVSKILGDIL